MERGILVMGKLSKQESNEVIHCHVSAVCRGEESTSTNEDDSRQGQVSQPIQVTSHEWEAPVIAHGGLVHYPNMIVEQVRSKEYVHMIIHVRGSRSIRNLVAISQRYY